MKHSKIYFILLLGFVLFPFSGVYGQVQFEPVGMLYFGYENNIFQAPDKLLDATGNYIPESDLILSDQFMDYGYNLGLKYKAKKHRFYVDQGFWGRSYFNNHSLNQSDLDLKLKYKYDISKKISAGLMYDFSKAKKIGTSVMGDELMQKFSYIKNGVEIFFDAEITKSTDAGIMLFWNMKIYEKDPAVTPLDAVRLGAELNFSQDLKLGDLKSDIHAKLSYALRNFTDVIALDANGNSSPTNPLREWRYYGFDFDYTIRELGNFTLAPAYRYDRRKDLFEDYYSYKSNEVGLKAYYKGKKFTSKLFPFYSVVKYDVKTAPSNNGVDPLLVYKYLDLELQMNYLLFTGFNVIFDFATLDRNTNTLDESYTTRRGYKSYYVMAGISFNPYQIFVDKTIDEDERK